MREICKLRIDPTLIEWPKICFVTPEKTWLTSDLIHHLNRVLSNECGDTKVLGYELVSHDIEAVKASARLMWWLMTLDASLLEIEARFLRWKKK